MIAPLPLEYRKSIWTPESTATLKALWAEGLSAAEIVPRINGGVTRNAVIGKLFRLGLPPRDALLLTWRQQIPMRKRTPEELWNINMRCRATRTAKRLMNGHSPPVAPINGKARHMLPRLWKTRHAQPVARPEGEPVSIIEVTGCKYAVKSEGRTHLFCNAPCEGPWCSFHQAIVYRPL